MYGRTMHIYCVLVYIVLVLVSPAAAHPCLSAPLNTTELNFHDDNYREGDTAEARACEGQAITYHCCMDGFRSISWSYMYHGKWLPIQESSNVHFDKRHQELLWLQTYSGDPKIYRCVGVGYKPGEQIQKVFELQVLDCGERGHPHYLNISHDVNVQEGHPTSIVCNVFPDGCDTSKPCNVYWLNTQVGKNLTGDEMVSTIKTQRISYANEECNGGYIRSILKITKVEASDFRSTFVCLATCIGDESPPKFKLLPIDKIVNYVWMYVLVAAVALVCIIGILALIFKVDIQIRWKTRPCRRRTIPEDDAHDICLLSVTEDSDRQMADMLYDYLSKELEFSVFGERDILYGEAPLNRYAGVLSKQPILVVLVSKALLEDHERTMCVRDAINSGQRTIYVKRDVVSDVGPDNKDILVAMRTGKQVDWSEEERKKRKLLCYCGGTKDDYKRKQLQLYILELLEKRSEEKKSRFLICWKAESQCQILQIEDQQARI